MIFLKTEEEIQGMKLAGDLLAKTHLALKKIIKPTVCIGICNIRL